MKTRKTLTALFAILMAALMLLGTVLPATAALNDPNNVKTIGLTLTAPKAGASVDLSYGSVTCAAPMEYRVVGVDWYKDNATDFMNDRLGRDGNDDYFIGGHDYTVKVTLQVKGDRRWNLDFKQNGDVDYSHITATVNGATATIEPHQVSPEGTDMLCVCYTFEDIAIGEIVPYVRVATPVAGQTKDDVIVDPYNERQMSRASWSEDFNWYHRVDGAWVAMDDDDIFMTGKDYRLIATFYANKGFRFSASGTHTVGDDGYIYGYVNGKQMSMKLTKVGGEFQYYRVTLTYDIVSCKAQELGSVSFEGIQAPVAGQHPLYAVTMGDSTYSLVTDDAVSGGAEYGFVNGLAWKLGYGESLTAQSTFEQGAYYTLSFFIRSDDLHRFTDFVTGSANVGYVEVEPMFDDPTLAFVTVDFAPCGGGVMNTVNVGGFREPVHGASPDGNLLCGQGYEKYGELQWFEVDDSGERAMSPNDAFTYGKRYKLVLVLKTTDGFTFAARSALTVNVNGKVADMLAGVANEAESEYVTVVKYFDCAKAPINEVRVTVENPMEGKCPAQQIQLGNDTYIVEGFMFADHETGTVLNPDHVFVGAKNYSVLVTIAAKEGYRIAEGGTAAFINDQEANVIAYSEDRVIFVLVLLAEELPFYGVSFSDGQSFLTKEGLITLPEYEGIVGDNEKFVGWTVDHQTTLVGEYYIAENTDFTAVVVAEDVHQHVYDNSYTDNGQGMHEKRCVDENCPDPVGSVISGQHQYGNSGPCDVICEICGHERTSESEGYGVHTYEFACSEVCPTCGKQRETTHTPGAAATCTEAQKCTVCSKILVDALGHTAGEAANCGHAQTCTVCGTELAPIQGEHVPGAAATCTEAQKCTVCQSELSPAKGHTAGVEWMQDENGHWHVCAVCNGEADRADHADADGDELCDVCGYDISKGLPGWGVALIVVGGVAVLGGGGFCLYWFVIRKKLATKK